MNYLLLFVIVVFITLQSILQKLYYKERTDGNPYIFTMLAAIASMVFFTVLSNGNFSFNVVTCVYAALFGIFIFAAIIFTGYAVRLGSLSLTSLVLSYSLIIPSVYGIVFLNEPVNPMLVVGLTMLFVSLFLINKTDGDKKITVKWAFFALLAFIGNGGCSTVQKIQQVACEGNYRYEFMFYAMLVVFVITFIKGVIIDKAYRQISLKQGGYFAPAYGISNALVNFLVMVLSAVMPAVVLFPSVSGGGIVITWFVSHFVFKEKLSLSQNIGVVLGTISVVLLSL